MEKITKKAIEEAINNQSRKVLNEDSKTIKTGYIDLDYMIGGLRRGETYILASRPAMGKTAFSLNLIENIAVKQNKVVAMFSTDACKNLLIKRLVQLVSRLDYKDFIEDTLENMNRVEKGIKELCKANFYINDYSNISVDEIRVCLEKIEEDVDLVIVDCLQSIGIENGDANTAQILGDFSEIAQAYNCPILILSQLSRRPDHRDEHRPVISDLMENNVARYVDNLFFLYRDEYYDTNTTEKGVAEIIIARAKNCSSGTVMLAWIPELQRFCSLEKIDWEDED